MEKISNNKHLILITIAILIAIILLIYYLYNNYFFRIEINGKSTIKLEYNTEFKDPGYKAFIDGKDVTELVKIEEDINAKKLGVYNVKYTIEKNGRKKVVERRVEVVDSTKPEITLLGREKINLCNNGEYTEEGFNAFDNFDGDITTKVKVEKKEGYIFYTVKDSNNNVSEVRREIIKKDITSPDIILHGSENIYVKQGDKYIEQGYDAIDNCDGDISKNITVTNKVDTNVVGTYDILYKVVDSSNNEKTVTRKVIVVNQNEEYPNNRGVIYLTFDDGPSKTITPMILDVLKTKDVKATFFILNPTNMEMLVKRAHNEGHTIALHSYTHNYKQIYSSEVEFFKDLKKLSDKVTSITGEKSYITRFPGGSGNTVSIKYNRGIVTRLADKLLKEGYRYYDWNVSSGDAGGAKNSNDVYRNVVGGLKKDRDNIVLLHDFNGNYKTAGAISDIIDYGIKNGYEFKAIDVKTPMIRHRIRN